MSFQQRFCMRRQICHREKSEGKVFGLFERIDSPMEERRPRMYKVVGSKSYRVIPKKVRSAHAHACIKKDSARKFKESREICIKDNCYVAQIALIVCCFCFSVVVFFHYYFILFFVVCFA